MLTKMSEQEIEGALKDVPDWSEMSGEIQRTFEFPDFVSSMAFVQRIADEAERVQHHPNILIRYNKVTLSVNTHDAGGITHKDFDLARFADRVSSEN